VIITEGEKKDVGAPTPGELEVSAPRFVPVGLSGVWNWRGIVGKEAGPDGGLRPVKGPIPDLGRVEWEEPPGLSSFFDSDVKRNPDV